MIGLFLLDLYYCKISLQEAMRIKELTELSKTKPINEIELFPLKLTKANWLRGLGFDHLWYLFVLLLGLIIICLRVHHYARVPFHLS